NIRMCYRGYSADEFNRIEKPLLLQTDLLLCKQAAQICFANNDTSDAEHAWRQALEAYEALEELATAGYPVNLPTEAIKEIEDYFQAAYPHPPSSP
ncbi:MAG: hypothetical protein K2X29_00640, partial [Candidatus Obscuribacterales bacterium]|nr:hypothetical protein [Candidatus Obscuribacterales bacterium]